MTGQDWFVTNDGQCNACEVASHDQDLTHSYPYRLYRFLTDVEDVLDRIADDRLRLQAICPLVRKLLISSSWLQITPLEPNSETGWEVLMRALRIKLEATNPKRLLHTVRGVGYVLRDYA
ncbi:hypothetical protein MiSe_27610 [Microseira wollei NIES-4236]|uniref:OmpR/PhoB-type domain-containing protein n=1 Tax=Microseira wollei NIES-4236 TaxID=2530354 RepID=A0AAV3XF06_9CYAN|nr:hypothetical protein MiSe_27610 [Microseira wollei NIES-4236]